jgi:hypothetical protein
MGPNNLHLLLISKESITICLDPPSTPSAVRLDGAFPAHSPMPYPSCSGITVKGSFFQPPSLCPLARFNLVLTRNNTEDYSLVLLAREVTFGSDNMVLFPYVTFPICENLRGNQFGLAVYGATETGGAALKVFPLCFFLRPLPFVLLYVLIC